MHNKLKINCINTTPGHKHRTTMENPCVAHPCGVCGESSIYGPNWLCLECHLLTAKTKTQEEHRDSGVNAFGLCEHRI